MRMIFMGTPAFSVQTLMALHGAGHQIVACYSQPPRPGGRRGLELTPSPVHKAAEALGIPVYTPKTLRDPDEQAIFAAHGADVAVVVAYGLILPRAVLDAPRLGCFNGHASLLPRWRGAAPIQRAIMAGDGETGMMVMQMEAGLDTGPVAMTERVPIGPDMTGGQLHDILSEKGAALMVKAMDALEAGTLTLTPQAEDGVTYAAKIDKAETRIDWTQPATDVHNRIRALSPAPGAWTEMEIAGKPERVKLLASQRVTERSKASSGTIDTGNGRIVVTCGAGGAVELTQLQRAGGKPVSAGDFLRGAVLAEQRLI